MTAPVRRLGVYCTSCRVEYDGSGAVMYVCSNCGGEPDEERRCDSCNRFKSRGEAEFGYCEDCFAELEQIELVDDVDGAAIPAEEYDPSGSVADREAARRADADAEAQRKAEAHARYVEAATAEVEWSALAAGAVLADERGREIVITELLVAAEGGGREPNSVVAVLDNGYYNRVECHSGAERVRAFVGRRGSTRAALVSTGVAPHGIDGAECDIFCVSRQPDGIVRIFATRDRSNYFSPVADLLLPEAMEELAAALRSILAAHAPDATPDRAAVRSDVIFSTESVTTSVELTAAHHNHLGETAVRVAQGSSTTILHRWSAIAALAEAVEREAATSRREWTAPVRG